MKIKTKRILQTAIAIGFISIIGAAKADIITVNTVDNTDFSPGMTNFLTAFNLLTNNGGGNTINFNIPGSGAHHILTPLSGYPIFTNLTNITINGYSQPGSVPNTHTILSSNNASITVYLDSSNGECTDLNHINTGQNGYDSEGALLPMLGWTNVNISGLGFLGVNPGGIGNNGDNMYAIAMGGNAASADVHIHGCRFGLDADGTTVKQFQKDIVTYGARNSGYYNLGVAPGSVNPRAEFNVFIGGYILFDIGPSSAGSLFHVSGNFLNVYPDGLHDFNVDGLTHAGVDHIVEAIFEFAGSGTNSIFGTDGDGVNDAEERNVIGGITAANDGNVWECYGSGPQGFKVAGNYWGIGVDGVTRFTNGGPNMVWLDIHKRNASRMQFGSEFDGISDALEANLFYWNNPFRTLYGNPPVPPPSGSDGAWAFFIGPPNNPGSDVFTGWISMRGNQMVNNLLSPYSYADGSGTPIGQGDLYPRFAAYETPFMDVSTATIYNDLLPKLSASSTSVDIIGTCPSTNGGAFSNIFVDVYVLDPEGWTNGQTLALAELTDGSTYTNGFPQGKTYLGTFVDNGPLDRDPAVGSFNFKANALGLAPGTQITIAANYSADPPGTVLGRTHTSNFSNPTTLRAPVKITSVTRAGSNVTITWTGGTAPYTLQRRSPLTGTWSAVQSSLPGPSTTYSDATPNQAYYQVIGN